MPRAMNDMPIVVITAGTPTLTVSRPFASPTRSATPSEQRTASGTDRPASRISLAANTAARLITAPVDRSISPAIINWTMPMLISPGKAIVRRIERRVAASTIAVFRE